MTAYYDRNISQNIYKSGKINDDDDDDVGGGNNTNNTTNNNQC